MTPSLIESFQNMSIRKGDTFHNPTTTNKNQLWDPLESKSQSLSMPARSTTCPQSLEDLLIGAGERRAAELFRRVDKAIATNSKLALGAVLSEPEVLPVPSFMLDHTSIQEDAAQTTRARVHRHSHSSDSGIGSSVAGSTDAVDAKRSTTDNTSKSTANQSFSGISAASDERGLSKYASEQIHKHIVKPILREAALQEFHPLINSVPERIGNKEIKNLRDLEKTLIFLAPRTIRVLHTTVTTLHESDQRAPADRPYTQGYFFDLVEQIRRYAAILAATRERQAKGEGTDEMDHTKSERVSLHGGMTHNGKAPELVRHTADGKAISLATGAVLSPEEIASSTMKRPFSDLEGEFNDDVARSMARRKKGAKPEIHECPLCDKEFKRPCDLTKHIKTHERPWKCTEESCKYHEHGWPTEKERDRHVNDKHSSAPSLYHCLFEPCPYTSKRESNCKQHMEKAHGWDYVRSKSNGKGNAISLTRMARGSVPQSPASAMLTPLTPIAPSPSNQSWSTSSHRDSMPPPGVAGPSNFGTPVFTHPSPDFAGHFNMNFNFNDMAAFPTPAMSDDRRTSSTSSYSRLQLDGSSFEDSISPHELNLGEFDFNNYAFQQPSPNCAVAGPSAAGAAMLHNLSVDSGFASSRAPHTSPGAQLEQTFTSNNFYDNMTIDEGFAGDFTTGPSEDFTLFGGAAQATAGGEMFPSLPAEGSSWGNFGGHFDASTLNMPIGNSALEELFPELNGH
ncbi:hypothetical protein LTR36_002678 [Oleoguttula mirabilis]|uniref:C2H2-type domain-containing protein n=1 Tax=Oleoguttula mirabilis TaxID=1507867 RepID=A0AAV9JKC5_9PEZI|nr:hypothetical protein LTR36_002678 [Oleoguttula mirabilis]